MWAINIESAGYVPLGNDGMQKLHNKTLKGWKKEAEIMRKNGGEVYVVKDIPQNILEGGNGKLTHYVMTNYVCILPKGE